MFDFLVPQDFFWRAVVAGVGVAVVAGPLGCIVVWRRMAYFGDTLAHAALLGVALGLVLEIDITLGIISTAIAIALIVAFYQHQKKIASDTLLGILAHSSLAISLVVIGFLETVRLDLMAYLFGDILTITANDIFWLYGAGGLALCALIYIWRPLIALSVNAELARAEGISVPLYRTLFTLILALVIALAMKIVGVLLITSLLIIPAATARRFANTPEQMAVVASSIGIVSVCGGLWSSLQWDSPSGPSIVVLELFFFLLSAGGLRLWKLCAKE